MRPLNPIIAPMRIHFARGGRARFGPYKLGTCAVCGAVVRTDDVLALAGRHLAHAECAVVRHLGSEVPADPRAEA